MTQTEKKRLEWVDRMRGLAILSVVVQHLTYGFPENEGYRYINLIALCNMGVFFFVSGYIIDKRCRIESGRDAARFLWKKCLQLMIPFLFWGFCGKYLFASTWNGITWEEVVHQWRTPGLWYLLTLFGYMFPYALYKLVDGRLSVAYRGVLASCRRGAVGCVPLYGRTEVCGRVPSLLCNGGDDGIA